MTMSFAHDASAVILFGKNVTTAEAMVVVDGMICNLMIRFGTTRTRGNSVTLAREKEAGLSAEVAVMQMVSINIK